MSNTVFNINNSEIKQFATGGVIERNDDYIPALFSTSSSFAVNTKAQPQKWYLLYNCKFQKDDEVIKDNGDYKFEGKVVSVFTKLSGDVRIVVEDDKGFLFIFSERELKHKERN